MNLVPIGLRGYQRSWLRQDIVAGLTLAAVAIPETMGYTSIAETPLVTGLYTVIFPTLAFALIGSSRLLVVGADSATAAILAAGLGALTIAGVSPGSQGWLQLAGVVALMAGGLLFLARIFKLGFIADFLAASVLIGFLTGVGIQVLTGQLPDMFGIPKGSGTWLSQQVHLLTNLDQIHWATFAFAMATLAIILGCQRFLPKVPGALAAVILLTTLSAVADAQADGVKVVGAVPAGFPPIGLPTGLNRGDFAALLGIAASCFFLIIAQSAATSRVFAMRHGDSVNINRDLIGLGASNLAAGLSGTFVVNGSPTKTQILDQQKGRTQLANITMALTVLVFTMFATTLLSPMPESVLAAIVFLIGVSLVDLLGLRVLFRKRRSEWVLAVVTAVIVFAIGVEEGIIFAIIGSIVNLVRRQYKPASYIVTMDDNNQPVYNPITKGAQSLPGLVVFRYDAELFYANAGRFTDQVEEIMAGAADPVRWVALDCAAMDDVDYSSGLALAQLSAYAHAHDAHFVLTRPDDSLLDTLRLYGLLDKISPNHIFGTFEETFDAFKALPPPAGEAAAVDSSAADSRK